MSTVGRTDWAPEDPLVLCIHLGLDPVNLLEIPGQPQVQLYACGSGVGGQGPLEDPQGIPEGQSVQCQEIRVRLHPVQQRSDHRIPGDGGLPRQSCQGRVQLVHQIPAFVVEAMAHGQGALQIRSLELPFV